MERRRLRVTGVVQGVGFRPFVYGLAPRLGLGGFVLNDGHGVASRSRASPPRSTRSRPGSRAEAPPLARVDAVDGEAAAGARRARLPDRGERRDRPARALIPPDVATCDDCLRELLDPADRRYRYPFVNCTQCGPRFTIVRAVPYDRPNTTMAGFPLCARTAGASTRIPPTGASTPSRSPARSAGRSSLLPLERGAVAAAARRARSSRSRGSAATTSPATPPSEEAVARLRARKHREDKPFARHDRRPAELAALAPTRRRCSCSAASGRSSCCAAARTRRSRRRWRRAAVARADAPVHAAPPPALRRPRRPARADERQPLRRADRLRGRRGARAARPGSPTRSSPTTGRSTAAARTPSCARAFAVRRSRGYAPAALPLPVPAPRPLVAAGAELKSDLLRRPRRRGLPLAAPRRPRLRAGLPRLPRRPRALSGDARRRPEVIAHDLHPDYLATRWAHEQEAELVGVQHHHAHAAACLAEHGETGPALALVFDGTGYGTDGTLWGGELLRCDLAGVRAARPPRAGAAAGRRGGDPRALAVGGRPPRAGRPAGPVRALAGGAAEPRRERAALLGDGPALRRGRGAARRARRGHLRGPGRDRARAARRRHRGRALRLALRRRRRPRRASSTTTSPRAAPRPEIAAAFHETVAAAAAAACAEAAGPRTVVLSGGSFQNLRLLAATRRGLEAKGFRVLTHRRVPPNDGGISVRPGSGRRRAAYGIRHVVGQEPASSGPKGRPMDFLARDGSSGPVAHPGALGVALLRARGADS